MTGDKTLTYPLTDEEKALVEQYHDLIWKVMWDMRLPYSIRDDLYDVGALALMLAARKYRTQSELQKYAFATIAIKNIKSTYKNAIRDKKATVSLDAEISEGKLTLHDVISAPDYVPENSERVLKAHRRVKELLTEKEYMCVELYARGLSSTQVKQYYGISCAACNSATQRARRKCSSYYAAIFDTAENVKIQKRGYRRITDEERAEILRLFDEGISMRQIERMLGRNIASISQHIKKARQAAT